MNLPNDIKERIQNSPKKGVGCNFVKIDDDWGIKAFYNKSTCHRHHENQQEYAKRGLAPPCEDSIFKIGHYYCYATRVAEILICPSTYLEDVQLWEETYEENEERIEEWQEESADHGFPFYHDTHPGNFGWFEGKFVLIDCGRD